MDHGVNRSSRNRRYHAPRRAAAAAETRQAILLAAKEEFEARGWAGTTMRSIAARAGVSPKTVEALFATKPALLEATLLAVVGPDAAGTDTGPFLRPEAVLEMLGETAGEMESAPDAAAMLDLLTAGVSDLGARANRMFWAVETAVPTDARLAEIWARFIECQLVAIRRWAEILLEKSGRRADLTLREAEETLLLAADWSPYRTLTTKGGMTPEEFEAWANRYCRRMLLA
jgi:AcrR family transcriptional regulator